ARAGLGVAVEHVVTLGDEHPEVSAPAFVLRLDERARRVDADPTRRRLRILEHRLHDRLEKPSGGLDPSGEGRPRKRESFALEDLLLPMQRDVVTELMISTCASSPGPAMPRGMGRSGISAITIGAASLWSSRVSA